MRRETCEPEREARVPWRLDGLISRTFPEASDEQLRAMRRVGRPPLGEEARRLIAIRLDPEVLIRS